MGIRRNLLHGRPGDCAPENDTEVLGKGKDMREHSRGPGRTGKAKAGVLEGREQHQRLKHPGERQDSVQRQSKAVLTHHKGKVLFLSRPMRFLLIVVEHGTASRWWELLGRVGTHWLFLLAFCSLETQRRK